MARQWFELQDYNFISRNPPRGALSIINITEDEWLPAAQLQDERIREITNILLRRDNCLENKHYCQLYELN